MSAHVFVHRLLRVAIALLGVALHFVIGVLHNVRLRGFTPLTLCLLLLVLLALLSQLGVDVGITDYLLWIPKAD